MSKKKAKAKPAGGSRTGVATKRKAKSRGTAVVRSKAKASAKPRTKAKGVGKKKPATKVAAKSVTSRDWRLDTLARMRALIFEADSEMVEERKWKKPSNAMVGIPVWSHHGIVCTGETYKGVVKLTFAKGASLPDPSRLLNASLEGGTRRAIDIHEGEQVDAKAFQALILAAVAENDPTAKKAKPAAAKAKPVKLLSGGNPQIAKGDGDSPVQAYMDAMPGWKRDVGNQLDAIIDRTVPNLKKAVKWNSPLYGVEGGGWFLGLHCFERYVKVAFFKGAALDPLPPGPSRDKNTRYLDIYEHTPLDEAQFAKWVKQAAALPGWMS